MTDHAILHVLLLDDDYAVTAHGSNAQDAVRGHYDEMDMYCAPSPDCSTNEEVVTVFTIPAALEDRIGGDIEDMDSGDLAAAILDYEREHPEIIISYVTMQYEAGKLRVA